MAKKTFHRDVKRVKYLPKDEYSYALVTGASSGMGKEYARKLYSYGYNLIIVSRRQKDIDAVRDEFKTGKNSIISVALDLSEPSAADDLYVMFKDKKVDVLINNAGVLSYCDYLSSHVEDIEGTLILHNYTLVKLCRLFGPPMKERGYGFILNISSLAAWMPYPGLAIYSATKNFNKSFSRSLRIELIGSGVSVTTAYFGAVATNLFQLSQKHKKLAIKLRIMISARKAAEKALNAMFNKKAEVMPGIINWIAIPIFLIQPNWALHFIDKKIGSKYKNKS